MALLSHRTYYMCNQNSTVAHLEFVVANAKFIFAAEYKEDTMYTTAHIGMQLLDQFGTQTLVTSWLVVLSASNSGELVHLK